MAPTMPSHQDNKKNKDKNKNNDDKRAGATGCDGVL